MSELKPDCLNCSHSRFPCKGLYCYMFKEIPNIIPCAQHDMYSELRKATEKVLKENLYNLLKEEK